MVQEPQFGILGQLTPLALDRSNHPRNYGALPHWDARARITGPCGDTMEFWLQVDLGRICAAGFTTSGCGTSRAAGSMTTELAVGKRLAEAARIEQADVLRALGGLPPDSEHCALLAVNTLRAALDNLQPPGAERD
jgi:nitrogen fixation NifU-like protein